MNRETINLYEFQKLTNSEFKKNIEDCLGLKIDDNYVQIVKDNLLQINNSLKPNVIKLNHDSIQATQYVGFIKLKDFSLQIIPKIHKTEEILPNLQYLVFILEYLDLFGISLKKLNLGLLGKQRGNLFQFLIEIFISRLNDQIKKGIHKTYVEVKKSTEFIRGKLLIKRQAKSNYPKPWVFNCRYEEFVENNSINQIFKFVLLLIKNSYNVKNEKKIDNLLILLHNVDLINIKPYHFKKIVFTRLNIQFKPLIDFCKLIISNCNIDLQNRKIKNLYFLFNMNLLFENFIRRFIQNNKDKIKINMKYHLNIVKKNPPIGNLFKVKLEPDLLIKYTKNGIKDKILIDFKYKFLKPDEVRVGVKREDIYQMFAYSQSQEKKYSKIVLIYPKTFLDKFKVLEHHIESNKKIKIYLRCIDLSNIYLSEENRFSELSLIEEINKVMMFK